MQNPDNLRVMGEARLLALEVYRVTGGFPSTERFGLTAQMRRAAISIGSNIAEGCGRIGNRELVQFLQIALGSATELEFQAQIAMDLVMLSEADAASAQERIVTVKRMLTGLIKSHRTRSTSASAAAV